MHLRVEVDALQEENRWLHQRVRSLLGHALGGASPDAVAAAASPLQRRRRRRQQSRAGGEQQIVVQTAEDAEVIPHISMKEEPQRPDMCAADAEEVAGSALFTVPTCGSCSCACRLQTARRDEVLQDLHRQLEEKDVAISSLRVQAELLGVRKGLERQLKGAKDFGAKCRALMASVSRRTGINQHWQKSMAAQSPSPTKAAHTALGVG